jgi:acetyltransferase
LDKLFNPGSIAIIGASRHKEKLGYQILDNLIKSGYKGNIYPVNPEAEAILNIKTYKKITDINDSIDLALIVVPAQFVLEVLKECVNKNVAYAIIISSGFSEIGPKGEKIQKQILEEIVGGSELRIVGPNCLGVINANTNLNLTFALPKLVKGGVSAVFQSGALGVALLDWANKYDFGFAKFVSLGNKVDIEESDIIEYLADDPETKIIALYVEEILKPSKFFQKARYVSNKKPIVILKGGTTPMGARAAFSHTAAMISPEHINRAIFSQANIISSKSIDEMLNIIQILSCEPPVRNRNLAIITNAGGPGILTTDAASKCGLQLPQSNKAANPMDLLGEAKAIDYDKALNYFTHDDSISSIFVLLTPQTSTEITETAETIAKYNQVTKPIIASFLGYNSVEQGIEILKKYKISHFDDPEEGVEALSKVIKYWEKYFAKKDLIDVKALDQPPSPLGDALELVDDNNIPIPPSGVATTIDVALKIVGRIGLPVAVKNVSKKYVHKYKAGKVILNVQSESYLKEAVRKVGYPVLIQRMVDSPFEVIVGAKRDPKIGTMVTFGWGGIFAEDLSDISTRILPITEFDLDEMIRETKIGSIIIHEEIDLSAIKNIIINVCQLMSDHPEISELDLNPIKLTKDSAMCVDARYK